MSRLTARTETGHAYLVNVRPDEQEVDSPHKNTLQCILDCFERLAQYEDAEEQGRLVRVPCKIGDTVWAIRSYHGILRPQQGVVSEMYFRLDMTLQIVVKHVTRGELGRTIFLTREEAEAALKEAQHE